MNPGFPPDLNKAFAGHASALLGCETYYGLVLGNVSLHKARRPAASRLLICLQTKCGLRYQLFDFHQNSLLLTTQRIRQRISPDLPLLLVACALVSSGFKHFIPGSAFFLRFLFFASSSRLWLKVAWWRKPPPDWQNRSGHQQTIRTITILYSVSINFIIFSQPPHADG
ncbi:uncharacterized protein BDCG_16937 [Blastomyces dermatitidis ER-3]|uniref:Uncharacterized protein n=2 Tax=Ajellomyces dermatitidis TaxID=5039 RepID=A0A0J9HIB4_AJEDA|nr:uncharacterized protein BDCG_16937 [Blastomyces dermatitidis ER-3]EEQ89344.2 hypothetical protein BDCG_16937 [Blastomyces dermatitidis ER-3]KMW68914.1 hypothetical protein BDDG_13125 [Blastomyces dermatitidis ATCC 18188]